MYYKGAATQEKKNQLKQTCVAYSVVIKLLEMGNYLNKGYQVHCDNFFTSIPLAKWLHELGTYITGTIRANGKFLPRLAKTRFAVGVKRFFQNLENSAFLICGYRQKQSQKKQVLFISTHSQATSTPVVRRMRDNHNPEVEPVYKPDVILA